DEVEVVEVAAQLPGRAERRVDGHLVATGKGRKYAWHHAELQIVADRQLLLHPVAVGADDIVGGLELGRRARHGQPRPREEAAEPNDEQERDSGGHARVPLVVAEGAVGLSHSDLCRAADAVALVPGPGADDGHAARVAIAVEIYP